MMALMIWKEKEKRWGDNEYERIIKEGGLLVFTKLAEVIGKKFNRKHLPSPEISGLRTYLRSTYLNLQRKQQ
jgi:hypothetical protein